MVESCFPSQELCRPLTRSTHTAWQKGRKTEQTFLFLATHEFSMQKYSGFAT